MVSTASDIYTTILDACPRLRSATFSLSGVPSEHYQFVWQRLVNAMPHLPQSAQLVILEIRRPADINVIRGVQDLRRAFEALVAERRPPMVLSVRPDGRPMLELGEQMAIQPLFPRLTADALLQF